MKNSYPCFGRAISLIAFTLALVFSPAAFAQVTYEYDALGRLVKTTDTREEYEEEYEYDALGNRESVSATLYTGVSFSIDDVSVTEGGSAQFTITKTGYDGAAHEVDYATENDTALAGSDYTAVTATTLTFGASETSKQVTISTSDDSTDEPSEIFNVNLTNATPGATISDAQGLATINDNDPGPSFSVNDVSVTEGGNLVFTITKSGSTAQSHAVSYATANGTASGGDYTSASGSHTFTSGQTTKTVSVATTGDTTSENDETVLLNLSSPTNGATISDSQGVGTINDDDPSSVQVQTSAAVIQTGFRQTSTYFSKVDEYTYKIWDDTGSSSVLLYTSFWGQYGWCDTAVTLASGYSWTGNGCEIVKN